MKKFLIALIAFGLTSAAVLAVTVTNRGEVISITTYDDMVTATQNTNVTTLASGPWVSFLSTDTALTATDVAGNFVPDGPGQLVIGIFSATATGAVYYSDGWTTNDWKLLK